MFGEHESTVAARLVNANQFYIDAPIEVHYDSTSFNGMPLLSYRDTIHDLNFSGEEITRAETSVGELVTVTLDALPDAFTCTFTLVVPTVLVEEGDEVEFVGVGVETTDRSGRLDLPLGRAGALQTHRLHQLSGTARFVVP